MQGNRPSDQNQPPAIHTALPTISRATEIDRSQSPPRYRQSVARPKSTAANQRPRPRPPLRAYRCALAAVLPLHRRDRITANQSPSRHQPPRGRALWARSASAAPLAPFGARRRPRSARRPYAGGGPARGLATNNNVSSVSLPPLSPRRRPAPPSVKGGSGRGAAFAPVVIIALPLPTALFYYSLRLVRAQSARGVGSPPAPVRRPLPTWGGDKRNARVARKNTLFGWCWCASRSGSARLGFPRLAACAVPKARRRTFAAAARLCAAGAGLSGWLGCLSLRSWGLAGSLGRSLSVSAAGHAPIVKGALACRRPVAP